MALLGVLALLVAVPPVAAQPLQPPCRAASAQSAALQDAVEGIAGLMQRFEELQPQISQLPATELQQIASPAQKLHERFENMQKKLVANGNNNANPELEEAGESFQEISSAKNMRNLKPLELFCAWNDLFPLKHRKKHMKNELS